MNKLHLLVFLLPLFINASVKAATQSSTSNVILTGTLLHEACKILPGDDEINLDFQDTVNKYLYLNDRTLGVPFSIRLTDCDHVIGKDLSITFTGTGNASLPDFLAINTSSQAKGFAIGIEDTIGNSIIINRKKYLEKINKSSTSLNFKAFIKAEPLAKANKTIQVGGFTATSTFILDYE